MRETFNHDGTNILDRNDVQAEISLRDEEPPLEMPFGEWLSDEMERMEEGGRNGSTNWTAI